LSARRPLHQLMAKAVKVTEFDQAVHDILEEYFDGVATKSTQLVAEVSTEAVQELDANSPAKTGKYKKGWRIKQGKKAKQTNEVEIYNTRYQLTHLLEHGHIKVVHGKVLGFTAPRPHIANAEQHAIQKLIDGIERSAK